MIKKKSIFHRRHSVQSVSTPKQSPKVGNSNTPSESAMEQLIFDLYLAPKSPSTPKNRRQSLQISPRVTCQKISFKKLFFGSEDISPASPTAKNRRQSLQISPRVTCQKNSFKKLFFGSGDISPPSPTASELASEQLIFDLFLNSPTKQRRMRENEKEHEFQKAIKAPESPRLGCIPRISLAPYSCQLVSLNNESNSN